MKLFLCRMEIDGAVQWHALTACSASVAVGDAAVLYAAHAVGHASITATQIDYRAGHRLIGEAVAPEVAEALIGGGAAMAAE